MLCFETNELINMEVNSVRAVCDESRTYGSDRGKICEDLPIENRYPSSPCRKRFTFSIQ